VLPVKRAPASAAAAATVASLASWRLILLPLVHEDPAGGGVYCLSGGGWEDGGSMFGLGEMDCFIVSFPQRRWRWHPGLVSFVLAKGWSSCASLGLRPLSASLL